MKGYEGLWRVGSTLHKDNLVIIRILNPGNEGWRVNGKILWRSAEKLKILNSLHSLSSFLCRHLATEDAEEVMTWGLGHWPALLFEFCSPTADGRGLDWLLAIYEHHITYLPITASFRQKNQARGIPEDGLWDKKDNFWRIPKYKLQRISPRFTFQFLQLYCVTDIG